MAFDDLKLTTYKRYFHRDSSFWWMTRDEIVFNWTKFRCGLIFLMSILSCGIFYLTGSYNQTLYFQMYPIR